MTTTSRQILADVLTGKMSLKDAAPALREASISEAYCMLAKEEENGTYTLMNVAQANDLKAPLFSKPYAANLSVEMFTKYYRPSITGLFKEGKVYRMPGVLEDPKEFLAALESLFKCPEVQHAMGKTLDLSSLTDNELNTLIDVMETAQGKNKKRFRDM